MISVAVTDRNIDKSLVLYWKISGIELTPGSKIFTARCKNLYVLTTKHKITGKNKINKIRIESPFEQIVKTIDYNDYSYRDIDTEENLEIVNDRISTTKRIANEKPESSSSSKRTSYETNSISNFMKMNNYLSNVMVDKFKILILYALRNIKVVDIRKIILEKAFGKYYMTRVNYIPYLPNYSYKYLR